MATGAAIGAFAVGTAFQVKGQLDAAEAQAEHLRSEATSRRSQAKELLRRGQIQLTNIKLQGKQLIGEQTAATAAKGFDVGTGSSLAIMEQTQRNIVDRVLESERELNFQNASLLAGATSFEDAARRTKRAGDVGAVGTLFSGAGRLFLASGAGGKGKGTK